MVWLLFCWLRPGMIIISASAAQLPWAQGCLPSLGFRKSFFIIMFHLASKRGLSISPPCYWTWMHGLISGSVIHSRAKSTFDWIFGGAKTLGVFFNIWKRFWLLKTKPASCSLISEFTSFFRTLKMVLPLAVGLYDVRFHPGDISISPNTVYDSE